MARSAGVKVSSTIAMLKMPRPQKMPKVRIAWMSNQTSDMKLSAAMVQAASITGPTRTRCR